MAQHGGSDEIVERDDATVLAVREAVAALPRRQREAGLDPAAADEEAGPPGRGADPPITRARTPRPTTTRRPTSSATTAGTHTGSTHDHEESHR